MEAIKKDFSPRQLKDLILEIEEAPSRTKDNSFDSDEDSDTFIDSIILAQSLGEELEELAVFGNSAPLHSPTGFQPDIQFSEVTPQNPQEPSVSSPSSKSLEEWLQTIVKQKIDEKLGAQDLEEIVSKKLQYIVSSLAEDLITREIERIKTQIEGL